jgi:hypothetical protein
MLRGNFVKIFNSTQTFKNVFVLKFQLILIIGSNNVLTEGAREVYRGRRVGQGWSRQMAALLSALRSGRALLPRNIFFCFWYSSLLEAE